MIPIVRRLVLVMGLSATMSDCHAPAPETFKGANLVLISIDTLRADHLPAYGYRGVETPHLDSLRKDGVLFENAYSHCPLTLPSHVSILSGLLPPQHGVRDNLGYTYDATAHPGLPAALKAAAYTTGAAVSAYVLRGKTGLSSSFDFYDDDIEMPAEAGSAALARRRGDLTEARAEAWLRTVRPPFFLFFHIYEPHLPYEPPEPFKSRYPLAYDGEIAAADAIVGSLLDALKRQNAYDPSLIVLLSDHGEGLGDHGEADHGILLYREDLRVPLLLKLPGSLRKGEWIARPVGLIDLAPTVASLLSLSPKTPFPGTSLFGSDRGGGVYSETYYARIHLGWSDLHSLIDSRFQLIDGPAPELYDFKSDVRETSNLFGSRGDLGTAMRGKLASLAGGFEAPLPPDPETEERLRSLGYLGGTVETPATGTLPNPRDHLGEIDELKKAFSLAAATRPAEALAAIQALVRKNPDNFDVRVKEGEVLLTLGRPQEALEVWKKAVALAPRLASGFASSFGRAHLVLGDLEKAGTEAQVAVQINPPDGHKLLAEIALKRNDLKAAETEGDWLAVHPGSAVEGALTLAEVRIRQGRFDEARQLLDAARGSGPPILNLDFLRGDAFARQNLLPEAEAAFRHEIQAFPGNSPAYARLAVVSALRRGSVSEVNAILEEMNAANPGTLSEHLAAETLDSLGNHSEALKWRRRSPDPSTKSRSQ